MEKYGIQLVIKFAEQLLSLDLNVLKPLPLTVLIDSCLKFRQLVSVALTGLLVIGCGAKSSNQPVAQDFYKKEISFLVIEKECQNSVVELSPLTSRINEFYSSMLRDRPLAFFNLPIRIYDPQAPLIISTEKLENELLQLEERAKLPTEVESILAGDLYHLYQNANRFESLKCSLSQLTRNKGADLRPYFSLSDFCLKKTGSSSCSLDMTVEDDTEQRFLYEKTMALCRSFKNDVSCQADWILSKKNDETHKIVRLYQERFQLERFETLFKLRTNHLRFSCVKEERTSMKIKVFQGAWEIETLKNMLSYVTKQWTNEHFKLEFEIVQDQSLPNETVVEIVPTKSFNSFVVDDNPRIVHLSDKLDFGTKQKVLAHEFGHVLGFPDCYIEFFDEKEKELVYYEQGRDDTNIMCSLKNGVHASDQYINQLRERSCIFSSM